MASDRFRKCTFPILTESASLNCSNELKEFCRAIYILEFVYGRYSDVLQEGLVLFNALPEKTRVQVLIGFCYKIKRKKTTPAAKPETK